MKSFSSKTFIAFTGAMVLAAGCATRPTETPAEQTTVEPRRQCIPVEKNQVVIENQTPMENLAALVGYDRKTWKTVALAKKSPLRIEARPLSKKQPAGVYLHMGEESALSAGASYGIVIENDRLTVRPDSSICL